MDPKRIQHADIDYDGHKVTVYTAGRPAGKAVVFTDNPLSREIFRHLTPRLSTEGGTWGSIATLLGVAAWVRRSTNRVHQSESPPIMTWADPRITEYTLAKLAHESKEGYWPMMQPILLETIHHAGHSKVSEWRRHIFDYRSFSRRSAGKPPMRSLKGQRSTGAYGADSANLLYRMAKNEWRDWASGFRSVCRDLEIPAEGSHLWELEPSYIIDACERIIERSIGPSSERDTAIRLLHFCKTGRSRRTTRLQTKDGRRSVSTTCSHVFPSITASNDRLIACGSLLALLIGINRDAIASLHERSLTVHGPGVGVLTTYKGRDNEQRFPIGRQTIKLWKDLLALTAIDRARRRRNADSEIALQSATLAFATSMHDTIGFSGESSFARRFQEATGETLSWDRLRKTKLFRTNRFNGDMRLPGQSTQTGLAYMAKFVPEQYRDAILRGRMEHLNAILTDDQPSQYEASEDPGAQFSEGIQVSVSACTNGGRQPDGGKAPCQLGIIGCLACPYARISSANLAGLHAAAYYARHRMDSVGKDADDGKAAALSILAGEAIRRLKGAEPSSKAISDAIPLVVTHYHRVPTAPTIRGRRP